MLKIPNKAWGYWRNDHEWFAMFMSGSVNDVFARIPDLAQVLRTKEKRGN